MDRYVLLAVALVFAVYIVFRFRPSFSHRGDRGAARAALKDAKARLDAAKTDPERALCLGDAADASAKAGRTNGAVGYYMRAMRLDPRSAALIEHAAAGLADHPRALETLLWRRLGAEPWTGETAPAAVAALRHLAHVYARGPLRHTVRARTFRHALMALSPEAAAQLDREVSAEEPRATNSSTDRGFQGVPSPARRDDENY